MEEDMNKELIEALDVLEKEKGIDREVIFDAIENSLLSAYKSHVEKVDNIKVNADNVKVNVDRKTGDFSIIVEKRVVEEVTDKTTEITLDEALLINKKLRVETDSFQSAIASTDAFFSHCGIFSGTTTV